MSAQFRDSIPSLQIGLLLPTYDGMVGGQTPRWDDLLAIAQRAESLGFDALWVVDHLVIPVDRYVPQAEPMGAWECWSLLAALAAATSRIKLGSLVTCTAFRNPALLAKMADTVDEVSGGRLILGLGAGSIPNEFAAFGYPADHRVDRFEEALTIVRGLLHGESVTLDGRYYQTQECELRPRGPRPDGLPILVGARSPRMDRLAARHADIWNAAWPNRAETLAPRIAAIDAACDEVGRDPESLERTVGMMVDLPGLGPSPDWLWAKIVREPNRPLTGSAEEIAAELQACVALGVTHAQVWLDPPGLDGVEAFAPVLELLGRGGTDGWD
ncbi:MAG: LLM class flavin-dependent oxidoreductase, partial [Chloroflexota bacterium]|nr:LLM class flavin-dependent oxidoreductase [Chloroflexota bacterium]